MSRPTRFALFCVVASLLCPGLTASNNETLDDLIRQAMRSGNRDIPGRMRTLAGLAWGEDTESEALAFRAREKLIESGHSGMGAITEALTWAEPTRFADIMLTSIETEARFSSGDSPYTGPAIERCLWFGPPDAKRVAMEYLSIRPIGIFLLAVMDSAYDYPELTPAVIDTLALMRDPRARFFLADRLQTGTPAIRRRAAEALAAIGGPAHEYLRAWALSEERELRQVAFRALLPVSTIGDLTTLYEYVALFPDDDPEMLAALRARAERLEEALARQEQLDSATPALDD